MKLRRQSSQSPVSDVLWTLFETGELPDRGSAPGWWDVFLKSDDELRADWQTVRDDLLAEWIAENPGKRPAAWWSYDAPEPRHRLGGHGDPEHEHLNTLPSFSFGIPTAWVSAFQVSYYNGRALDVHGKRIGKEYSEGHFKGVAINPADPPLYESQTAYLDRHELLSAAERRRLPGDAYMPEIVTAPDAETPDVRQQYPSTFDRKCFDDRRQ